MGKPKEQIEMSANLTMEDKLGAQRKLYEKLSLEQLQELARESEAQVEKARAIARSTYPTAISSTLDEAQTTDARATAQTAASSISRGRAEALRPSRP